ncbi:unnamed protein product, partial [Rotaria sp. Silwood1]
MRKNPIFYSNETLNHTTESSTGKKILAVLKFDVTSVKRPLITITNIITAVFCGLLPLILPNSNPFQSNWKYEPIVQWNTLVKNISWSAIFLLGAGLSVASAFTNSKLSESVAQALRFLHRVPHTAVIMLVIVISGLFTEVTSNLSTASIFLPVLDSV